MPTRTCRSSGSSQCDRVLAYMEEFGSISQLEALRYLSVQRLAPRIADLEAQGHDIVHEWASDWNRFGKRTRFMKYRLRKEGNDEG